MRSSAYDCQSVITQAICELSDHNMDLISTFREVRKASHIEQNNDLMAKIIKNQLTISELIVIRREVRANNG